MLLVICFLRMCAGYMRLPHMVFILAALTRSCVGIGELNNPAVEFSKYNIVHPVIHHGRTKREISSTKYTNGAHHSEVQMTVPLDGEPWVLDLRLNEDLVTSGHTLQYQEAGNTVKRVPKKEEFDLCHYSGSVRDKPHSWVAVSTCRGVRGVIFDGHKMRYIEPAQDSKIQSPHYLYDQKHLITQRSSSDPHNKSGVDHSIRNDTINGPMRSSKQRGIKRKYKRETDNPQIREPYNANKSSRYVELVLVADHRQYVAKNRDVWAVHSQLVQIANVMNAIYSPLNIFIALVGVVVWSEGDKINVVKNGDDTLIEFLKYRKNKLVFEIPHDNAHLLTHLKFYDGVVGKALPYSMCKLSSSGGVEVMHTDVIGLQAVTVAHEMGHNFGIHLHDEECGIIRCPDEKCIMSMSSTSVIPEHWSSCSLEALEKAFAKGQDYCLHNKPERLAESRTCGNGFVEPGEQCDCGLTAGGGRSPCHACCDPDTCMLRSNATCGTGSCCDLTTCRLKSAGVMCRSAERECDLPEYCTGHSEYCPADVYKMDSTPCGQGNNQAYCMQGSCQSHSDQCRLLWGPSGRTDDECYSKNTAGTREGNCGFDPRTGYQACPAIDAMCGLLQCHSDQNYLHHAMGYGSDSGSEARASSYVRNRVRFDCFTGKFNLGANSVDLGMVPDGAKCGHEKMCLKQRCVSVNLVREQVAALDSSVCPSNCSGHGVCNTKGHCHCDEGFSPPYCSTRGPGGSVDSGPATKTSEYFTPSPVKPGNAYVTPKHAKPHRGYVNPRPINPSNGYVTPRHVKHNLGYINTPTPVNPSKDYVTPRPVNPNNGYVTPGYNKPNFGNNKTPIPVKPNNGYVTPRPIIPSNGYVTPRYIKPNYGYNNTPKPAKPNNDYVTPRPVKPSNGYVTPRYVKPNYGYNKTPMSVKPNNGYVTSRPVNPSNGYVTPRHVKPNYGNNKTPIPVKPNNGYVTPRSVIPSNGYVTPRYIRPNYGYNNTPIPTKPNNGYVTPRPVNPSNGYVTPRPVEPSDKYVVPRPVKPSSSNDTPRFVKPRPDKASYGYNVPTSVNPENRYVTTRTVEHNYNYVTPKPVSSEATADSNGNGNVVIILYVIFLGIVPAFIILLALIYYYCLRDYKLWRDPKKCWFNHIRSCCVENYSKLLKIWKKSTSDDVNLEGTEKNNISKISTLIKNDQKSHVKHILKDDIKVIRDVKVDTLETVMKTDDILTAINNFKLEPVNHMKRINEDLIQTAINDDKSNSMDENTKLAPKHMEPVFNNINNEYANIKFNNPMSNDKKDSNLMAKIKLNPINPMLVVKNDIRTISNVKTNSNNVLSHSNSPNDIRIGINTVKLKHVEPRSNNKHDIQIVTNGKLEHVEQKTYNDNVKLEFNNIKLKPVNPLVSNKLKPQMKPKPEWLKSKHVS